MGLYRKKPVVIEAGQWFKLGDHPEVRIPVWSHCNGCLCEVCGKPLDDIHGFVKGHRVCPGDWIIRSVKGELYACKSDIFEATYERVNSRN